MTREMMNDGQTSEAVRRVSMCADREKATTWGVQQETRRGYGDDDWRGRSNRQNAPSSLPKGEEPPREE